MHLNETITRLVLVEIARSAAGHQLCLIGGMRYRLINGSPRVSNDLDFSCGDEPHIRQAEIVTLCREVILPLVRTRYGLSGSADAAAGPDANSPVCSTVDLAFWTDAPPYFRIDLPIDITTFPCLDTPEPHVIDGSICLAASDRDMIENKLLALFSRSVTAARDFVDLFLFGSGLHPVDPGRLLRKMATIGLSCGDAHAKLSGFLHARVEHCQKIERVCREQLEESTYRSLSKAGGVGTLFDSVLRQIDAVIKKCEEHAR